MIGFYFNGPIEVPEDKYIWNFSHNSGWICPKCHKVWSPDVEECWSCNDCLENNEEE